MSLEELEKEITEKMENLKREREKNHRDDKEKKK